MPTNDILDFIFGGNRGGPTPTIDSARLLSLSDTNNLVFTAPDFSPQAQFRAKAFANVGIRVPDQDNTLLQRQSQIQLDDSQIVRGPNGQLQIDFTQFGGQQFNGTLEELSQLQGQSLVDTIGISAFDVASGLTLPQELTQQRTNLAQPNGITNANTSNQLVQSIVPQQTPQPSAQPQQVNTPRQATTANQAQSQQQLAADLAATAGGNTAITQPQTFLQLSDTNVDLDPQIASELDGLVSGEARQSLLDLILANQNG